MKVEVTIDAMVLEALPAGMSPEALQAAMMAGIATEIRALGPQAADLAATPGAAAEFSAAIGKAISRRLGR